jgi:hypothetical protein
MFKMNHKRLIFVSVVVLLFVGTFVSVSGLHQPWHNTLPSPVIASCNTLSEEACVARNDCFWSSLSCKDVLDAGIIFNNLNPIHHYDFNDGTATDGAGDWDGEIKGALTSTGPDGSGAFTYWNPNGNPKPRIVLPDSRDLSLDSGSISLWAKYTGGGGLGPSNGNRYIFGRYAGGGGGAVPGALTLYYNGYENENDRMRFIMRDNSGGWKSIYSLEPFNDFSKKNNGWHHYVATWSDEKTELYIDGAKQGEAAGTTLPVHTAGLDLTIGRRKDADETIGWVGPIDEFEIYDYQLSELSVRGILQETASYCDIDQVGNSDVVGVYGDYGSVCARRAQVPGTGITEFRNHLSNTNCEYVFRGVPIMLELGEEGYQLGYGGGRFSSHWGWQAFCGDYLEDIGHVGFTYTEGDWIPDTLEKAKQCINNLDDDATDIDFFDDTCFTAAGPGAGIKFATSGNLVFHANQWNGAENQGEIDITCEGGDAECLFTSGEGLGQQRYVNLDIRSGPAALGDDASFEGYIMSSVEDVHTRFSPAPLATQSNNFVGVCYRDGVWYYGVNNENEGCSNVFTPRSSDILLARFTIQDGFVTIDESYVSPAESFCNVPESPPAPIGQFDDLATACSQRADQEGVNDYSNTIQDDWICESVYRGMPILRDPQYGDLAFVYKNNNDRLGSDFEWYDLCSAFIDTNPTGWSDDYTPVDVERAKACLNNLDGNVNLNTLDFFEESCPEIVALDDLDQDGVYDDGTDLCPDTPQTKRDGSAFPRNVDNGLVNAAGCMVGDVIGRGCVNIDELWWFGSRGFAPFDPEKVFQNLDIWCVEE